MYLNISPAFYKIRRNIHDVLYSKEPVQQLYTLETKLYLVFRSHRKCSLIVKPFFMESLELSHFELKINLVGIRIIITVGTRRCQILH